jgi:hypothetical protein
MNGIFTLSFLTGIHFQLKYFFRDLNEARQFCNMT